MARVKNKHGLTHQQELFCQYVVDAYDTNPKGIITKAYEMAYNCKSDSKKDTHYQCASRLMNDRKITARIEQLREELAAEVTIPREQLVKRDCDILGFDLLELYALDEETGTLRKKRLNEIPKRIRLLLDPSRKSLAPDKDAAQKRLIDILGYSKGTDVNLNGNIFDGKIRIGFDEED